MVKNKIYKYIILEYLNHFYLYYSLSLIAWTVRAVNFLDLIVDSGYSTKLILLILFKFNKYYNKFIPLSFLIIIAFNNNKIRKTK